MKMNRRRRLIELFCVAAAALALTPQLSAVASLPESMALYAGGAVELPASSAMRASLGEADGTVAEIEPGADSGVQLSAKGEGSASLTYSLLGVMPFRTVSVSVEPERVLIPGGQSVGVAIDTRGVVVIGASDLGQTPSPARVAGIRAGDIIRAVDGEPVESAKALSDGIASGETVRLEILRNGEQIACDVTPALDARDGSWRLGAWVRDSTAGVGTLTFSDPETNLYGALGHAITDVDTSVTMPVGTGELYANNVVDVTRGADGAPGELTGDFVFHATPIGTVERNSDRGIFGITEKPVENTLYPDGLPAAKRGEIHVGPATLLTTVDEGGVREYACEIVRLNAHGSADTRSMVVRVTDPDLIAKTGGIVQGMSGSPLIQDGKLIGAVTHVMINDPTMGYGISIESMLESASEIPMDSEMAA